MAFYMNLFHEGPPSPKNLGPNITRIPLFYDGFNWVTQLSENIGGWMSVSTLAQNASNDTTDNFIQLGQEAGKNLWNIYDEHSGVISADAGTTAESSQPGNLMASFDESVFTDPLEYLLTSTVFFQNGTTSAVVFKTDVQISRGRISAGVTIALLFLPVLWTFLIALLLNVRPRRTAVLDSFALLKLGGDWCDDLEDLRMISMQKGKERLFSIQGPVLVDPERGSVKLAHCQELTRVKIGDGGEQEDDVNVTPNKY